MTLMKSLVVRSHEADAFVGVNNPDKYVWKLLDRKLRVQSADVVIPPIESLSFEPQDVDAAERNWAIDFFGTEDDYAEFKRRVIGRNPKPCLVIVCDTGTPDHPDMNKTLLGGTSHTGEPDVDRHSHSTACGSYIGADNANISPLHGVIDWLALYYEKVLRNSGSGSFTQIEAGTDHAAGLAEQYTKEGWLVVVNYSLGAQAQTPTSMGRALDRLEAAGAIIVAATGNNGQEFIGTPANYAKVLATGALNRNSTKASFSNYGDGMYHIAPGVQMYGCDLNGRYTFKSGTSMGSPISIIPLIMAHLLYDFESNRALLDYVRSTYTDLGPKGHDKEFGYGVGMLTTMLRNAPDSDEPGDGPGDGPDDPPPPPPPPEGPEVEYELPLENFTMRWGWNFKATRNLNIEKIVVRGKSRKGEVLGVGEIKAAVDLFMTRNALSMAADQEFVEAAYYTALFTEIIARQQGIVLQVHLIEASNEDGLPIRFTYDRLRHHRVSQSPTPQGATLYIDGKRVAHIYQP